MLQCDAVQKLKLNAANSGKSADPILYWESPLLKNRSDETAILKIKELLILDLIYHLK
jgi:hypothetical protein